MLREGVPRRSWGPRPDPILHILVGDRRIWCSGSQGVEANTVSRVRCTTCTALLREGVAEETYSQQDLDDWLASTSPARRLRWS